MSLSRHSDNNLPVTRRPWRGSLQGEARFYLNCHSPASAHRDPVSAVLISLAVMRPTR